MSKKISESEKFGFQSESSGSSKLGGALDERLSSTGSVGIGDDVGVDSIVVKTALLLARGLARTPQGPADSVSFETIGEYLTYLFEATTKDAFVDGKFPGHRVARYVEPKIDAELVVFWKTFLQNVEDRGDSSAVPSIFWIRNSLHNFVKTAKLEPLFMQYLNIAVTDILDDHEKSLKRAYRKRAELPDPTKPANAPVNLRRKQVALRFLPELTDAIDTALQRDGGDRTRNDWVTEAVEEKLLRDHPDLLNQPSEPTDTEPTPKK